MSSSVTPERKTDPVGEGKLRLRHRLSAWVPVLICILVIATESTTFFGADHTSGPLQRFCEFFFGPFTGPQWWRIHMIIRKTGHFLGYGILSISWFRAFWMTFRLGEDPYRRWVYAHCLAMFGTLLVASSDELHQLFLPNRSGSIVDVMIDCSGGLLMQAVIWTQMRQRLGPQLEAQA